MISLGIPILTGDWHITDWRDTLCILRLAWEGTLKFDSPGLMISISHVAENLSIPINYNYVFEVEREMQVSC